MSLPDKTYRRTLLGSAEMRAMPTNLPRKLRGLLSLIDGQTPTSKLASFLTNFGDVEALLEALELNGLIEDVSDFPAIGATGTDSTASQMPLRRRASDEYAHTDPNDPYPRASVAPPPIPARHVEPQSNGQPSSQSAPPTTAPHLFQASNPISSAAAGSAIDATAQSVDQVLDIRDVRNLLADALAEVFSDESMALSMQVEKASTLQELKELAPYVVALLDKSGSDRLKSHAGEFQLITNR